MADTKITDLTALTGASSASGDLFPVVDVSDTTMAASGTNKKMTRDELRIAAGSPNTHAVVPGTKPWGIPGSALIANAGANTARSATRIYYEPFSITSPITISDVMIWVITTSASGGSTARLGLVTFGDAAMGTRTVVADWGTVAIDSTGIKSVTGLSTVVPPGHHALVSWYGAAVTAVKYVRCPANTVEAGADFFAITGMAADVTYAGSWPTMPAPVQIQDASTPGFWRTMYVKWGA